MEEVHQISRGKKGGKRMKKLSVVFLVLGILLATGMSWADEEQPKFLGPGTVSIATKGDILMSFGAQARFVPTSESNWDFGMSDKVPGYLVNLPAAVRKDSKFFEMHANEAGTVRETYIRSEDRLYFNAMPKDKAWSFYMALEFDSALDNDVVDRSRTSDNFGIERLNASVALPFDMRLHAGWDALGVDIGYGGLVYVDDNPGFWLEGGGDKVSWNLLYLILKENNWQTSVGNAVGTPQFWQADADRDTMGGWLDFKPYKDQKLRFFYLYDRIRNAPVRDFLFAMSNGNVGISGSANPKVNSHHLGAIWSGNFGTFQTWLEGVYQFGSADDTGLEKYGLPKDYDIKAYAFAGDISCDLKNVFGFSVKPHIGFIYTSGDDNRNDDELNGYVGVVNAQRFSPFGGEHTIIADTNWLLGTALYGFLPEFYGNGTPVMIGGVGNFTGLGHGRGDNPGMSMLSAGITFAPSNFFIFRTNANLFWWNEDIYVGNWVNPVAGFGNYTKVEKGYVGTEWDNEFTLAIHKNVAFKLQGSLFFPGDMLKDVTKAMIGTQADDTAYRIAAEFILNF